MSEIVRADVAIVGTRLDIRSMDELGRLSAMLAKSGFFSDAKDAAQAGVKVLAGMEMGFPSIASMTGIHLVKGKVQMGANLIAAAIKRSESYDYRIMRDSAGKLRFNSDECAIAFYQKYEGKWEEIGESVFTITDAKKQGTGNLDKFPKNMLFARAMSNGAKWYCPDIFLGVTVYTEGEIQELPNESIPVIPDDDLLEADVVPSRSEIINAKVKELGLDYKIPRKLLKEELEGAELKDLTEGQFEWLLKQLDLIASELDASEEAELINA